MQHIFRHYPLYFEQRLKKSYIKNSICIERLYIVLRTRMLKKSRTNMDLEIYGTRPNLSALIYKYGFNTVNLKFSDKTNIESPI